MSTQEIREIFKNAQIVKIQASKRLQAQKDASLEAMLTRIYTNYFDLLKDPKVPVGVQDQLKREMTECLSIIEMDSDHDVIMALTNNMIEKKYKDKIKNDS